MSVADIRGAKRAPKKAPTPSKQDLRTWTDALRAAGELQDISGAERETEIGGIVDLYMRKMGNPAVLFDDIPGYLPGHSPRCGASISRSACRSTVPRWSSSPTGANT